MKKNELELCVFVHLVRELRNGDIAIEGGDHYADHREQLLPWVQCIPKLVDYSEATGFPTEANGFVDYLQTQFLETTRKADAFLALNPLKTNKKGELVLSRYKTHTVSKEFLKLEQEVLKRLPSRTLIEALVNAHRACTFTRHFGPKKGTAPKISDPVAKHLITTFAYSTHLGPTQAATHLRGNFDARELRYINRHHMTAERLYLATRDVINHYNRIPIGALWGSGMHSGADGTHIEIYQGNKFSEHHIRYGKPGGIAYHYVSMSATNTWCCSPHLFRAAPGKACTFSTSSRRILLRFSPRPFTPIHKGNRPRSLVCPICWVPSSCLVFATGAI